MSIVITTTVNNTGTITAKGQGKQRTVKPSKGHADGDHGSAVGTLLNVLLDDRQQAMLRHPTGGQRVRVESTFEPYAKAVWTITV
jgi:hypothetical protein